MRGPSSIVRREDRLFGVTICPRTMVSRTCTRRSSSSTSRQRRPMISPRRMAVPSANSTMWRARRHQSASPVGVLLEPAVRREQRCDLGLGEDRHLRHVDAGHLGVSTGFVWISRQRRATLNITRSSAELVLHRLRRHPDGGRVGDVRVDRDRVDPGDVGVTEERDQPAGDDRPVVGDRRRLQVPSRQVVGREPLGERGEGDSAGFRHCSRST